MNHVFGYITTSFAPQDSQSGIALKNKKIDAHTEHIMLAPRHIRIGRALIGPGHPTFLIAEAGVNHCGDFDMACRLVRAAAEAGAHCVKFQTFRAERVVRGDAPKPPYQLRNTGADESQYAMLKRLEMQERWYEPLMRLCEDEGLLFLSTPYDVEDVRFLASLDVAAYKVPSALAVEPDYLTCLARTGKPVFLAAGMCTLPEIAAAAQTLRDAGNSDMVVMQCTTNYPSRPEDCHLRVIPALAQALDVLVGYSDHTEGLQAAIMAATLGACVVERHFTLDKNLPGPDHKSSSDPAELAELARSLRAVETILGQPIKQPCPEELTNRTLMRRSLVTACDLPAGTVLQREHLACKRPATGLSPAHLPVFLGAVLRLALPANTQLEFTHIETGPSPDVSTHLLGPDVLEDVKHLFAELDGSPDEALFHPHPFTPDMAEKLCAITDRRDIYTLFVRNGEFVGYGMLRGWDEGFATPSLGLFLRAQYRGFGLAFACMELLHNLARQRGANTIRVTVGNDNIPSFRMLLRHGYTVSEIRETGKVLHCGLL